MLPVGDEVVGERLAQDVMDDQGHVLLSSKVPLTSRYVRLLRERGFQSVPVRDPVAPDVRARDVLSRELREIATATVRNTLEQLGANHEVPVAAVMKVVDEILDALSRHGDLATNVASLRNLHEGVFFHSVNVAVYSILLGQSVVMALADLRDLGVGGLLHDVGKVYFMDLVNKRGALTPEEYARVRLHTTAGFNLLRAQPAVPLLAAHMAFQHHERLDGSGYPRGIDDRQIHPWAKIVAIADIFDTITSDRTYGRARPAHLAMAELRCMADARQLDERLVRLLMQRIAAYPDGSIVLLASGDVAVVVEQTDRPQNPRFRMVADADRRLVDGGEHLADGASAATTIHAVLADYPQRVLEQMAGRRGTGRRPRPRPRPKAPSDIDLW